MNVQEFDLHELDHEELFELVDVLNAQADAAAVPVMRSAALEAADQVLGELRRRAVDQVKTMPNPDLEAAAEQFEAAYHAATTPAKVDHWARTLAAVLAELAARDQRYATDHGLRGQEDIN